MAKRNNSRKRYGQLALTMDGSVWTWSFGGSHWRWCLLGPLEIIQGDKVARVARCKKLEEAMAYTAGVVYGLDCGRRGGMPSKN